MKLGYKIATALALAVALVGCQKGKSKTALIDPNALQGLVHFKNDGSVSAVITDTTIKFYRGGTKALTKDGDCENFEGASGVVCFNRSKYKFYKDGKEIGRFAPFRSNTPKPALNTTTKIVTKPVKKPTQTSGAATADKAIAAGKTDTSTTVKPAEAPKK